MVYCGMMTSLSSSNRTECNVRNRIQCRFPRLTQYSCLKYELNVLLYPFAFSCEMFFATIYDTYILAINFDCKQYSLMGVLTKRVWKLSGLFILSVFTLVPIGVQISSTLYNT